ncbi:hypothetical protein [Estrella lausannensis]|uniref:Uncharacterized protein n=1 Tax=Estrella lausannensis TaxID=483423 RepID=A0A0H5DRW2_9BACT|nr:hypothetical protein [Estrella lausannensis]CRX38973.1 conserved hypothetical protein [Estrella lausannensis]
MINGTSLHQFAQTQLQQSDIKIQPDETGQNTKVSAEIQLNGRTVLLTLVYNASTFREENVKPHLLEAIVKAEGLGRVYELGSKTKSISINRNNELSLQTLDGRDKEKGDVTKALIDKKVKLLKKLDDIEEGQTPTQGKEKSPDALNRRIGLINHCLKDCLHVDIPEPMPKTQETLGSHPQSMTIEAREPSRKEKLRGRLSLIDSLKEKALIAARYTQKVAIHTFEKIKKTFVSGILKIGGAEARELDASQAANRAADTIGGKAEMLEGGKRIEMTWDDGEGHSAKEVIERRDTVKSLRKQSLQELKYITSRLKNEPLDAPAKEKLEARKQQLLEIIQRCDSSPVEWANSDYFRDILRGDPLLSSKENPEGLEGAINRYEHLMQKEYLTLAPSVNMRYHSCSVEGKQEGWLRLGIISDMSNGFVDLQSLQVLRKSLLNNDSETASTLRKEIASDIISFWRDAALSNKVNADASAGYALRELGYSMETIVAIKAAIDKTRPVSKTLLALQPQDMPALKDRMDKTIEKRMQVMQGQFLQMVADHAGRLSEEDVQSGMMKMIHVSLLSQSSKAIDGSGWFHNEEVEIKDMAALFDHFDNKMLIADAKGPFIDKDGNLHVPPNAAFQEGQELSLRSIFVNQSVQGNTKNNKTQRKINERAYAKLSEFHLADDKPLKRLLHGRKSGYTNAADTVDLVIKAGFKTSTGCLSAKDRTGFVSALKVDRLMKNNGFTPKVRRRILRHQLGPDSPAVLVIKDNTGTSIMKIKPFLIEGLTKDTFSIKGWTTRATVYLRQGIEILKERRRIKKYEKAGKAAPAA